MKQIISWILILSLILCLSGCGSPELRRPGTFYYCRAETAFSGTESVLAPEQRELYGIEADPGAILALYWEGPESRALEFPLPTDCAVPCYTLEGEVLKLHFQSDIASLTGVELTIAAGCLARTLLPLTGAKQLVLTADGALLGGETAMTLTLEELALRDDSLDLLHGSYTIYYTGMERRYLIGQSLSFNVPSREELPMLLLEAMFTPPAGTDLRSVLPEGSRLLGVSVKDGLCTVDLSAEFDSRRYYTHLGQILSLMGIVNTLCALDEIDQVEFTINGDLLIHYGSLTIPGPLVPDERLIGPVRTALGEHDGTIFLTESSDTALISFPVRIHQSGSLSQPELIMRSVLSDPGTNGLGTCIPAGTSLNSITVENGICFVDLSVEYLSKPEDLLASGRVIAASLCRLEEVDAVSITVEGLVPAGYDSSFFGLLTPDDSWFL